jgi:thiol-disulfide isomerase/thioredoxin
MKRNSLIMSVLMSGLILTFAACSESNADAKADSRPQKTAVKQDVPKAFNFSVTTLEGNNVSLDDYSGKVLILDLWDTWCPPCKAEIPHFIDLYTRYESKGLEILGVAFGREGEPAVRNFAKDYGVNYANALANQELMNGFGPISSIPTTFVIDQNGGIYKKYIGYKEKSVFENDIKTLLNL